MYPGAQSGVTEPRGTVVLFRGGGAKTGSQGILGVSETAGLVVSLCGENTGSQGHSVDTLWRSGCLVLWDRD